MILIDKPYASEFFLSTLENTFVPVIHTSVVDELAVGKKLNLISEADAIKQLHETEIPLLYTNSENSISWIESNLKHTRLPEQIKVFKNKIRFRDLIKDMYPQYFYKGIALNLLDNLNVTNSKFPFILKPAVGFFSLGVYMVENLQEWEKVKIKIKQETGLIKNLYPTEVLDIKELIIEECIYGDEFAIDCYFNQHSNPVVLNIMKHIFADDKDVNDRVYITSKEIIENYKDVITAFLSEIGKRAGLRNFPAHVEVRISEDGTIAPIEVNPLRFGGWCSTPDLAWHAFGINIYEYLFQQRKPDWNQLLMGKENLIYSNIVLNNNTGKEGKLIKLFDYDKLLYDFEKPLELRKADYTRFPLFGFLFCETRAENMQELTRILMSDLNEYVV